MRRLSAALPKGKSPPPAKGRGKDGAHRLTILEKSKSHFSKGSETRHPVARKPGALGTPKMGHPGTEGCAIKIPTLSRKVRETRMGQPTVTPSEARDL